MVKFRLVRLYRKVCDELRNYNLFNFVFILIKILREYNIYYYLFKRKDYFIHLL